MNKDPLPHPYVLGDGPASRSGWKLAPVSVGALTSLAAVVLGRDEPFGLQQWPSKVLLAAGGGLVGYSACVAFDWLRWRLVRGLLSYHGWMHAPGSSTAKVWGILLKLLRGPEPFSTLAFQPYLPKQPLPDLNDTLDKWLTSSKELLTEEEFELTLDAVDEFRVNEGPKVQAYLQEKAQTEDNWLSEYWLNIAYLANREPIAINNNYYVMSTSPTSMTTNAVAKAAVTIHCHLEYYHGLTCEGWPPTFLGNVVPLCMEGYRYIYNTVRLPGEQMDVIHRHPSQRHIIVFRKSHFFKVDMYAADNKRRQQRHLTAEEIYAQLEHVCRIADEVPTPPPVASLTTQRRPTWAKHREILKVKNEEVLAAVESAMFIIVLDDYTPKGYADQAHRVLTGSGYDHWFDKCFTCVISANGTQRAWNVEHSVIDAMVFSSLVDHSFLHEEAKFAKDGGVAEDPIHSARQLDIPRRLEWDISGLEEEVQHSFTMYKSVVDSLEVHACDFPYGKGFIKTCRLSPDGFIQMALQLAYYRMHKETPRTYEPSTSRMFLLGRTETIHPVSASSVAWTKAMDDPNSSAQQCQQLLKKAVKHQSQDRLEATIGQGCDRHLLALYCVSRELGMAVPKLFMDKAWQLPFKLSTSQTPTRLWEYGANIVYEGCSGGFGPACNDGYGIAYFVFGDNIITMHVTSWKSCETTNSARFGAELYRAFEDMKKIYA